MMNWFDNFLYILGLLGLNNKNDFPKDMEIKYFNGVFSEKLTPDLYGSIHILQCPLVNKDLEKELLCGLHAKYSTGNVLLYSGSIKNVLSNGDDINLFCIDLVVDNMLKNFDTRYLWHGKCFISSLSPTEVLLDHKIEFKDTVNQTMYSITTNGSMIYKASLPALKEQNYAAYDVKDDEYLTTSHFHIFDDFYTPKIKDYCPTKVQDTGLMTVKFGKMDKVYLRKLDNLNDIFIAENFGKYFGFSSSFNKNSLDINNCVTGFIHDIKYMDTGRAIAVNKDVTIPLAEDVKSLSTTKTIPAPFDDIDVDIIRQLGVLTELQKSQSFDVNNAIMDYFLYGRL